MSERGRSLTPVRLEAFLAATPDPPVDLIEGLFGPGELAVLGAEPKLGKTWFALQVAIAAAGATPLAAYWPVPKRVRTLFVAEEGRPGDLKDRLGQLLADTGEAAALELFVLPFRGFRLDAPDDVAELVRQVTDLEIGLVVLDPLYRMHRQDENDAVAMRSVIAALRSVADTGAGVLLVHHLRKPARDTRSGSGASGADLRGTGALHAAYDAGIVLTAKPDSERITARVERRAGPGDDLELLRGVDGPGFVVLPAELTPSTGTAVGARRRSSRGR